jgi:hypothetical protein
MSQIYEQYYQDKEAEARGEFTRAQKKEIAQAKLDGRIVDSSPGFSEKVTNFLKEAISPTTPGSLSLGAGALSLGAGALVLAGGGVAMAGIGAVMLTASLAMWYDDHSKSSDICSDTNKPKF